MTVSRGRERGMIFTDLPRDELLAAIARGDNAQVGHRAVAAEAQAGRRRRAAKAEGRMRQFMEKVRAAYRQLRRKAAETIRQPFRQRELGLCTIRCGRRGRYDPDRLLRGDGGRQARRKTRRCSLP